MICSARTGVAALLAAALAVLGCADDQDTGGGGGAAGSSSGGSSGGGSGGRGGIDLGTGGRCSDTAGCIQTCGADNDFPERVPVASAALDCSFMGVRIPLRIDFAAATDAVIGVGDREITVAAKLIVPISTVDLLFNLACDFDVNELRGTVATSQMPDTTTIDLSGAPCTVCLEPGIEVQIRLDPETQIFSLATPGIGFTLVSISATLEAAGLEIVLSTEGEEPTCTWPTGPPTLTLSAP